MKPRLHVYIPGLAQRSYEYRRGDSILIYDDNKNAILIDGGEGELFNKMESFLKNNLMREDGWAHVTFVLTHWHCDHDNGLKSALDSGIIKVDRVFCPDPEELKLVPRDDGYAEYNRAQKRLKLAKDLKKEITYPAAGKRTGHWVGAIRMWMWRQKASNGDYVDYQVNNTSICTFFPDLEFLATGDTITSFDRYLKAYDYKITGFKIPHHGNACTYSSCDLLTEHGAQICYYTDWEPNGVGIGNTTFSKYGAGRARQYFTILRPFEDITIEADGMGHVTWSQGGKSWLFNVDYGKEEPIPDPEQKEDAVPVIRNNTGFKGYNVTKRTAKIEFIVVHYVGAESSAQDNVKYFNGGDRQASADYFVGHDGDVWEYNPDPLHQYSWHCGGGKQSSKGGAYYGICKNGNSIGVELCTKKSGSVWTFSKETVDAAVGLVKYLMKLYGIPAEKVIRHFDVNGKYCPQVPGWGAVDGSAEWEKFKQRIAGDSETPQIYRVRKSWDDAKSQIGAFSKLDNARAMAADHPGWKIFDSSGNEVA